MWIAPWEAGVTVQYPPLHELLSSKNKLIRHADYFMTYLNPAPHRRTFMKPFMREEVPEFCSACHKVHLDVPVNKYRWFRGFNDYDNWQASGVSGQGARSFYYPTKTQNCADCHMPMVASSDPGNIGGKVHSHRFPAANTAVPYANQDQAQLRLTEKFLTSGFISVDIFAVSPVEGDGHGDGAPYGRGSARHDRLRRGRGGRAVRRRHDPRGGAGGCAHRSFGNSSGAGIHRARRRGGADAQNRPLFPRRHGGRFRCLAGIAGARTPTAA